MSRLPLEDKVDDDKQGDPWRQAFFEFVKEDSTLLNPEEAMRLRRERLRYDLRVPDAVDVDQVVRVAKAAILEIVQDQSTFSWTAFNTLPWREALAHYEKVGGEEVWLPRDQQRTELYYELLVCKRALGHLLRQAARAVTSNTQLGELLKKKGIMVSSDTITRFLVSEINAEQEFPRIIGIISLHGPHYRPHYAVLSGVEFSPEFLAVCRIFDH